MFFKSEKRVFCRPRSRCVLEHASKFASETFQQSLSKAEKQVGCERVYHLPNTYIHTRCWTKCFGICIETAGATPLNKCEKMLITDILNLIDGRSLSGCFSVYPSDFVGEGVFFGRGLLRICFSDRDSWLSFGERGECREGLLRSSFLSGRFSGLAWNYVVIN